MSRVARLSHSYKSDAHEWRWPTQAERMRREFVETSMSWAGSVSGRLVPLSPRGRYVSMPLSCFFVGHSAGPLV